MTTELKINDWLYRALINNNSQLSFEVIPSYHVEKPKKLFKLYSPTKYAIESLLNNYVYANHPMQFNDLFDCHKNLIICDDDQNNQLTLAWLKELYGEQTFENLSQDQIKERIIEGRYDLAYITFGISSLTSDPNNVLMWAYYGNNQGFMVEYDCAMFPANFYGPFPINYQEKIIPISHKENNAQIAVLYQSNIKSKVWQHESEWRYLIRSADGSVLLPYNVSDDKNKTIHNRKFGYPKDTVLSISLGNRFFSHSEILEVSDDNILKIRFNNATDDRSKILLFAIENNLCINYALQQEDLMTVKFRKCVVEQKNNQEFWFH